jgi:hypothetical protein
LMNSLVEKLLEVFTAIQKSLDQYSKYFWVVFRETSVLQMASIWASLYLHDSLEKMWRICGAVEFVDTKRKLDKDASRKCWGEYEKSYEHFSRKKEGFIVPKAPQLLHLHTNPLRVKEKFTDTPRRFKTCLSCQRKAHQASTVGYSTVNTTDYR